MSIKFTFSKNFSNFCQSNQLQYFNIFHWAWIPRDASISSFFTLFLRTSKLWQCFSLLITKTLRTRRKYENRTFNELWKRARRTEHNAQQCVGIVRRRNDGDWTSLYHSTTQLCWDERRQNGVWCKNDTKVNIADAIQLVFELGVLCSNW